MEKWYEHYPKGMPHAMRYPNVPLDRLLDETAKRFPKQTALHFYGKDITYGEFDDMASRFAAALQKNNVRKGDRIVILLPNCPQYAIAILGALKAGTIVVPLNPLYSAEEMRYFFQDADPKVILTLDLLYDKVREASSSAKSLKRIVVTNAADYFSVPMRIIAKALRKVKSRRCKEIQFKGFLKIGPDYRKPKIYPKEDVALMLYTSGTTGKPKGVMMTHLNALSAILNLDRWAKIRQHSTFLCVLPLFHIYAINVVMFWSIVNGAKNVMLPKFSTVEAVNAIRKHKVNVFHGVPAMYSAMVNHFKEHKGNLPSLEVASVGSAVIPQELWKAAEAIMPNCRLMEGYGTTETTSIAVLDPDNPKFKKKADSTGIPFIGTKVRIVDPETGMDLGLGQAGELLVKSPQVFKGYWKKPEETKKVLRNGWYHTKDIFRIDEDGIFFIEGRLDDMINVNGEKVWPREIEKHLESHPKVREAAVVAVRHERHGHAIKAHAVLHDGHKATEKELMDHCRKGLVGHKVPHAIELLNELPKSHLGKTLHYKLRQKG